MAIEIDYNFENPEKQPEKISRVNFRLTRCCGNCKFFITKSASRYRGYCKYPIPGNKNLKRVKGEKLDPELKKTYFKTHVTMLCDLYQFSGHNVKRIQLWIDKKIKNDGIVEE